MAKKCPECNDTGYVVCESCGGDGVDTIPMKCSYCNGKGKVKCRECSREAF